MTTRWADADSSSDESEDRNNGFVAGRATVPLDRAPLNDRTLIATTAKKGHESVAADAKASGRFGGVSWYSDSDEEDETNVGDDDDDQSSSSTSTSSSDDVPAENSKEKLNGSHKEVDKMKLPKKPLSKKERKAIREQELAKLEDLLNEFGVSVQDDKQDEAKNEDANEDGRDCEESKSKKKKKKKKKVIEKKTDEVVIPATVAAEEVVEDVAAVLKAKVETSGRKKSAAEVAAATAAREAKAKKEADAKKKKKKNKDKYAHGAPKR